MIAKGNFRGKPIVTFLLLLAGWGGIRVMWWEAPFPSALPAVAELVTGHAAPSTSHRKSAPEVPLSREPLTPPAVPPRQPLWLLSVSEVRPAPTVRDTERYDPQLVSHEAQTTALVTPGIVEGETLFAATSAELEATPDSTALPSPVPERAIPFPAAPRLAGDAGFAASDGRWSGDAWLLLREDTTTPITSGRGSYGQSQAGAVLRYRLASSSGHRPAAYTRVSTALADPGRPEAAVGLTARPVPGVPIAIAAEARASELYYGTDIRPAVFAYSELPLLELPAGVRGEAYFQGGYVDGRFASAFVDGQVRVDRQLVRLGEAELRAGGGAWGGAQEGAERLDVGPAATIAADVGGAPIRMSADWRFRVTGDANPSSGPALTISAAF